MKITRQTETELVVVDSCLWLAIILMAVALILFYAALVSRTRNLLFAGGVMFLFGVPWLRKSTFTFDAARRMVRYRVLRYVKISTGSIPFADITGIGTETSFGTSNTTIYRLTVLTRNGPVPMADAYSGGGRNYYETTRQTIQNFVKGDVQSTTMSALEDREASIRSLIAQGRKIDAIRLLRNDEDLDLLQAKDRVDAIEKDMAAKKNS